MCRPFGRGMPRAVQSDSVWYHLDRKSVSKVHDARSKAKVSEATESLHRELNTLDLARASVPRMPGAR
jgi:hypothetical protein